MAAMPKDALIPHDQHVMAAPTGAMVTVEQQRAIAETQAAMMSAKRFPRDYVVALDRIQNAFTRESLAQVALYSYARGGTDITGPSIRAAEAIAQQWGNISYGIRELSQANGESEVEAFAWDLETNTRQVKVFKVPHIRYSRDKGNTILRDPRDIYEMIANNGARRLRACILGVIPGDVVETAINQAELTLKTKIELTPERIKALVEKFAEMGVTQVQIEAYIQRKLEAITPAAFYRLGKIFNSINDGMSKPSDWFDPIEDEKGEGQKQAATQTERVRQAAQAARSRQEKPAAAPKEEGGPEAFTDEAVALRAMDGAKDEGEASAIVDRCKGQPFYKHVVEAFNRRFGQQVE